ncbi:Ff.00g068950.m01.CDS01 [Fusarium sp. VM40]|nr:Ff.00g068950.m01.CDS01 [Fusarium sp. VM40]
MCTDLLNQPSNIGSDCMWIHFYGIWLVDHLRPPMQIPKVVLSLLDKLQTREIEIPRCVKKRAPHKSDIHRIWEATSYKDTCEYVSALFFDDDDHSVRFLRNEAMCAHFMRDLPVAHNYLPPPTPNIIYGYSKESLCQPNAPKLPIWLVEETKAETDLYYPFLVIKMQGDETNTNRKSHEAINDCMVASSICVGMIDKLNERLFELYNYNVPERLNDAVFGIVANGGVARVYVTYAWYKGTEHTLKVASFLLEDPERHLKFYKLVRSIIAWGNGERLEGILSALRVIRLGGPRWHRYPAYGEDTS